MKPTIPTQEIVLMAETPLEPGIAFTLHQGKSLLEVLLAIAAAADIDLTIAVHGTRKGESVLNMHTKPVKGKSS